MADPQQQHQEEEEEEQEEAAGIRAKLSGLADRFDGFEGQLQMHKKKKKDEIEKQLAELRAQIVDLQSVIVVEKRNSAQAMKSLQQWLEKRVDDMETRIVPPIHEKLAALDVRIDEVHTRIDELAVDVREERKVFPKMIDERAKELLQQIQAFESRFASGQKAREEKEAAVLERIEEEAAVSVRRVDVERVQREARIAQVAEEIEKESEIREKASTAVKKALEAHVVRIEASVKREVQARKEADEELVKAIQHYTAALQDSIKVVSED